MKTDMYFSVKYKNFYDVNSKFFEDIHCFFLTRNGLLMFALLFLSDINDQT